MRIRWRGLELPTRVLRDEVASTPTYGKFSVEPFERGFGTTVGNSLRRILLSSLEGAAVTHVRISGADHEFTTLPGVLEDVTVVILNVKSLVVRLATDTPKTMRLSVRGERGKMTQVRADRIECDPAIEIINKDQLICTLTDDANLELEMTVGLGRGYATADDHKVEGQDQVIGVIPVDSVYSPVTRVRYRVEDTRVGQRTNYDRLVMEIWTNGTLTPDMALVEAAKILRKHLNAFVQYFELGTALGMPGGDSDHLIGGPQGGKADPSLLSQPISFLDLSVRASNCLVSASITTVGELIQKEEADLLKLRSFGKTSLREVKRKLADHGLALKSDTGGPVDLDGGDDDEGGDEEESEYQSSGGVSEFGSAPVRFGVAGSMGSNPFAAPPSNGPSAETTPGNPV
ncbi:MAG: DNA-directed RNA polymerase subunit alpha [Planctomycetota bacterium]|nr:MAG: DNA-directed RNA polymerase subunit alpha [Planctomycetota bacterium]